MNKEKIIPNYLEATENILVSFRFNRIPHADDVSIVTIQTKKFTSALREIYFSDSKEKDNYYEVIYNVISKATSQICKENFGPDAYTDMWRTIQYSLEFAERHIQELHFKESNEIYPLPKEPTSNFKDKPEMQKAQFSIKQIALKYAYEEIPITRKNGNKIAKQYRHSSGEKLFQMFSYYYYAANRKGKPIVCTPRKLNNKIKLIESVITLLPIDKQARAKDEVSILKKIYDAEYQ